MELDLLIKTLQRLSTAEAEYRLTADDKNALRIAANELSDIHGALGYYRGRLAEAARILTD